MRCPGLSDLPQLPPGKTGWPWTRGSRELRPLNRAGGTWPRITVVTPSLNHGRFIEATIRSVLLQGYPDLEYFVLDGGSTDDTVEIIRRYSPWITAWASEPDAGQSDAINRGLRMASGEFACWINSDDLLCPDALGRHASEIGFEAHVVYVGKCVRIDEHGRYLSTHRARIGSVEDLLRVRTVWRAGRHILQPEVLFPRRLALAVGGLDVHNHRTMDYDLWGRLLLAGARVECTGIPFGVFRRHDAQKTHDGWRQAESLVETARKLVGRAQGLSRETRREILEEIEGYLDVYRQGSGTSPGRLDRLGLPPAVVNPLRRLRRWVSRTLHHGLE